ncbi:B3 domain-containing protein REM-like 2 [Arabidopsis lyrata subsp. lyrata]|uniref:B3 domain-containing protein REM-like 2 n=1 Tax=Arabidopsis lyrata subsp. lyrata TaxID=81972 RepID=UPI000A29B37E|nr:B3 domain-containing protein REM-like 2 [Arabidopsis lyrata subsp. lyrata]|eukprot:XP_020883519.1 B3 domain-containing protein REM-like 2 [Arabidopsis lyrata subsp. lyrata]
MMFNVSACGLGELPTPSNNKIGNISRKQHQRLRTEEGDDQDKTVLGRGKRIRKNNSQSEASSSSSNKSNLNEDVVSLLKVTYELLFLDYCLLLVQFGLGENL